MKIFIVGATGRVAKCVIDNLTAEVISFTAEAVTSKMLLKRN